MNCKTDGHRDNATNGYDPFVTFYRLYQRYRSGRNYFEKIKYAFSYMLERNLVHGEQKILEFFDCICSNTGKISVIKKIIQNQGKGFLNLDEPILVMKLLIQLEQKIEEFRGYNHKQKSEGLYGIFLDVMLPEMVWHGLRHIMLYSSNNTITYNELIRECIKKHLPNPKFEDFIISQEDVLRKLAADIYQYDDAKKYYRSFRGAGAFYKQNTLSYYEKDVYMLIYLLHGRRGLKFSDTVHVQGDLDEYNDLLAHYWKTNFSSDHELSEVVPCYKDYVEYILKHKPIKKTVNIEDSVNGMVLLHDTIVRYFLRYPETTWATMSSIFSEPWDFIQSASYIWNEKRETLYDDKSLTKIQKQILFMHYCKKISSLHLPKTQIKLIEEPQFFETYMECPCWLDDVIQLVRQMTGITGYYLSHFCGISDKAFSHSPEELTQIITTLNMYTYEFPPYKASPEIISDFLSLFLPCKA